MGANCNLDGSKKQLKKGGQETNGCSLVARVIFSLLKLQICREHFVLEKRALAFSIISMCTELAVTKKTISYSIMWLFGIIMQSSKGLLKVSKTAAVFNVNGVKRKKNMTGSFSSKLYIKNNSHQNDPETFFYVLCPFHTVCKYEDWRISFRN